MTTDNPTQQKLEPTDEPDIFDAVAEARTKNGGCLLCGHRDIDADGVTCAAPVPICSDSTHGLRHCGCRCVFLGPKDSAVYSEGFDDAARVSRVLNQVAATPAPVVEQERRHRKLTHEDDQRLQEAFDSLPECPTEEEAEAVLRLCGTSGKEVVNGFIDRLLKERSGMQAELDRLRATPSPSLAARVAAEEIHKLALTCKAMHYVPSVDRIESIITRFCSPVPTASNQQLSAMFTELYNCYTTSKCAATDREEFLRLKGMAEAYQDAANRCREWPNQRRNDGSVVSPVPAAGGDHHEPRSECCDAPVTFAHDGPICGKCGKWTTTK